MELSIVLFLTLLFSISAAQPVGSSASTPTSNTSTTPATPVSSSSPEGAQDFKYVIRGSVTCLLQSQHGASSTIKEKGITDVTVVLVCPSSSYSMNTDSHGRFKLKIVEGVNLAGFPSGCILSMQTYTLPTSCNIPLTATIQRLNQFSINNNTVTFTIPTFEVQPREFPPPGDGY